MTALGAVQRLGWAMRRPWAWPRRGAAWCAVLAVLAMAAAGGAWAGGASDHVFADGFDGGFVVSVAASASIRQGGVITLAVGVSGGDFSGGAFGLSGPGSLGLSSTARLYGAASDHLGFAFTSVSASGGNLTLFVGKDVAVGDYALSVVGVAGATAHTTSFTLQVVPKGSVVVIDPNTVGGYQAALSTLQPGEVLVLHQGTYTGSKTIHVSGTREMPITIRGYGHGEAKPVLRYAGSSQNHWEIRGSHFIAQGLEFDTPATYSIRIRPPSDGGEVDNVTLVNNRFVGCGGGCVSANDAGATYNDIRLIDNLMLGALHTPVYIGNQQGTATFHDFLFEGNVIDARSIVDSDVIGYGIEVKLNVEDAVLRHNYIVGARGPGIMTYGLEADKPADHRDIVEGNVVIGSCTAQNILIGAGPTLARHNLSIGGHSYGYGISDYGGWHLSAGIAVTGNTAVLNAPYGFYVKPTTAGTGLEDLRMTSNAAYPASAGHGYANLPADTPANDIGDNFSGTPTPTMLSEASQLDSIIPSPQDLKPIWPWLSEPPSPLPANYPENLLGALAALPNQSTNANPRACP